MRLHTYRESIFRFIAGDYSLLMMALILLYILRPHDFGFLYNAVWKLCFVSVNAYAILRRHHYSRLGRSIILLLAVPPVLLSSAAAWNDSKWIFVGITVSTICFLIVCSICILKEVMAKARVTLETLQGVISVYFILGFLFGYFFLFVELMIPGSILIRGEVVPVLPQSSLYFGEMLYFSFGTILTIGFGDIIAAKNLSQTIAVIEGIVGQLYVVMLLGRFVSGYANPQK